VDNYLVVSILELHQIAKLWVWVHVDCLACIIKIIVIPAGLLFSDYLNDGNKLGMQAESLGSVEERRVGSARWVDHYRHGSL
jgi:hypothetical protein